MARVRQLELGVVEPPAPAAPKKKRGKRRAPAVAVQAVSTPDVAPAAVELQSGLLATGAKVELVPVGKGVTVVLARRARAVVSCTCIRSAVASITIGTDAPSVLRLEDRTAPGAALPWLVAALKAGGTKKGRARSRRTG